MNALSTEHRIEAVKRGKEMINLLHPPANRKAQNPPKQQTHHSVSPFLVHYTMTAFTTSNWLSRFDFVDRSTFCEKWEMIASCQYNYHMINQRKYITYLHKCIPWEVEVESFLNHKSQHCCRRHLDSSSLIEL
jgi:hypothetical protein